MKKLFLLAVFLFAAVSLQAQELIEKLTMDELTKLFKDEGYAVSIDDDGDVLWKVEGTSTAVILTDEGTSLTFHVAFQNDSTTLAKVNEWNKTHKYCLSYLDDEGDPVLESFLDLEGGVGKARITDFFKTCKNLLLDWEKEVL